MQRCMKVKGVGMVNRKKASFSKLVKFEAAFSFKTCPFLMFAEIFACIGHGLSFVLVMYATQKFFDNVVRAVENNGTFYDLLWGALLLGGAVILNQLINGLENWLFDVLYEKLKGFAILKLYDKTYKIGAEEFEAPSFLDELKKAREGSEQFIFPLFPIIGTMTFYMSYFVGVGWYVYHIYPVLVYSILIVFIPSFLGQYIKSRMYSQLADETANCKRKVDYFEQCMCGREFFKETILLSATQYFKNLYIGAIKELSSKEWHTNKKSSLVLIFVRMLTLIGYLIILMMFVQALINGKITVGVFATIFSSIGKMFSMMDEVIDYLKSMVENIGLAGNYVNFLEKEEEIKEKKKISLSDKLELKNVTFCYKEANENTLENLNLTINAGDTVAIVGENGSGKSTLVKVLSGLYPPQSGKVIYDGVDVSMVDRESIYDIISIVGQNYIKYMLNVRNNVNISKDFNGEENGNALQDKAIEDLLNKVNLSLEQKKFKDEKLDTLLGREFGGEELSGGQWQRIAIARGMFRPHQIIIMDEPTAAIDPIEETKAFEMFSEISKGSTSVIVTHRMGCVKIANVILVMDKGKIVEVGSHEELMQKQGKYWQMYQAQLQWYQ